MAEQIGPTVNGFAAARVLVTVPNKGPWYADCDVAIEAALAGACVIKVSPTLELHGWVVREQSGTFAQTNMVRIVAGAAGWGRSLVARGYHNDAGVKAQTVAADAARECGETLGSFTPSAERLGPDYVRNVERASTALEAAAGDAAWWVDYAGVTHVGARAAHTLASEAYHVIGYNARERLVLLGADDPGLVTIGATLTEHLDEPGVIREVQLLADSKGLQLMAWLGGDENSPARLAGIMQAIITRVGARRLHGLYRYRVVKMFGDGRADLQSVRKASGMPDLSKVSLWPGVPGISTELTEAAEVLVQFIDGDRGHPIVTHFAGVQDEGFVPVGITIGGEDGPEAARKGDAVEVLLPPAVLTGSFVGPVPGPGGVVTGVLTFTANKALGTITAGSGKVKIA